MMKNTTIGYDQTKKMLNVLRKLNESKTTSNNILTEDENNLPTQNMQDDVTVVNDVDVKLLFTDPNDKKLSDQQKQVLSTVIDNFKQQVEQLVEFNPGFTIQPNQIRLDGNLTQEDISFVFIVGEEDGVYVNAEMLKLEQNTATILEKLAKFGEVFKSSLDDLITQRENN
jgi:hypothetical protein